MWTYSQTTGRIARDGVLVGIGYSGHGEGLNNPAMETIPDVGPIPHGSWRIARWDDTHGNKGPIVAVLQPLGHGAHGRTDFLIHGDNSAGDHSASHGCIIAAREIRQTMRASGDRQLNIVA